MPPRLRQDSIHADRYRHGHRRRTGSGRELSLSTEAIMSLSGAGSFIEAQASAAGARPGVFLFRGRGERGVKPRTTQFYGRREGYRTTESPNIAPYTSGLNAGALRRGPVKCTCGRAEATLWYVGGRAAGRRHPLRCGSYCFLSHLFKCILAASFHLFNSVKKNCAWPVPRQSAIHGERYRHGRRRLKGPAGRFPFPRKPS